MVRNTGKWILIGLAIVLLLSVGIYAGVQINKEIEMRPYLVDNVSMTVTEDTIQELEKYPNLKKADLTGSTCYQAIRDYAAAHPEVTVVFSVYLEHLELDPEITELTLTGDEVTYENLKETLVHLPSLKALHLSRTGYTLDQITALREAFSQAAVTYTVDFFGVEVPSDTQVLDMSAILPEQISMIPDLLPLLPQVTDIELMDERGNSALSLTDVKVLMDAAKDINVHYSFDLFGQKVSTQDTRIEFLNVQIGDEGELEIRQALDVLKNCVYFKLDSCGISNEVMASIRDSYPEKKIVWRVWYGKPSKNKNALTDIETLVATFCLEDDNCFNMRYFTDIKNLDIGHNDFLTDVSFLAFMPKLEVLILSGASVSDISSLKNCENVYFLEFAFCGLLQDISVLTELKELKYLNISFTMVSDLSAVNDHSLERLNCLGQKVPWEMRIDYEEKHPDCWCMWRGQQPYGKGWRYDDNGVTYSAIYRKIRDIFGYDFM